MDCTYPVLWWSSWLGNFVSSYLLTLTFTITKTLLYQVMDMTDMSELEDDSFDVVLDKAAMDALLSAEGDVWHPDPTLVILAHRMCQHIARILAREHGHHLQISFAQPHFRKKYLLGWHYFDSHPGERKIVEDPPKLDDYSHEYGWTFSIMSGTDRTRNSNFSELGFSKNRFAQH